MYCLLVLHQHASLQETFKYDLMPLVDLYFHCHLKPNLVFNLQFLGSKVKMDNHITPQVL